MGVLRRGCRGGLLTAVILLGGAPHAVADPQFPDLSGYAAVNPDDYQMDRPAPGSGYPEAWSGVVFSTPSGQRCSMKLNTRGGFLGATCVGNMLGDTTHSCVTAYDYEAGSFADCGGAGANGEYKLLPAGSKITVVWSSTGDSVTCAADQAMTACQTGQHGFVLSSADSWTF